MRRIVLGCEADLILVDKTVPFLNLGSTTVLSILPILLELIISGLRRKYDANFGHHLPERCFGLLLTVYQAR